MIEEIKIINGGSSMQAWLDTRPEQLAQFKLTNKTMEEMKIVKNDKIEEAKEVKPEQRFYLDFSSGENNERVTRVSMPAEDAHMLAKVFYTICKKAGIEDVQIADNFSKDENTTESNPESNENS